MEGKAKQEKEVLPGSFTKLTGEEEEHQNFCSFLPKEAAGEGGGLTLRSSQVRKQALRGQEKMEKSQVTHCAHPRRQVQINSPGNSAGGSFQRSRCPQDCCLWVVLPQVGLRSFGRQCREQERCWQSSSPEGGQRNFFAYFK